jgi:hypothetical protein
MTVAAKDSKPVSARGLIRAVADEFERESWRGYEALPVEIVERCQAQDGRLDSQAAAALASSSFLATNGIDRAKVQAALERAFAGRVLQEPRISSPIVVDQSNNITINVSDRGQADIGGITQTNLSATSSKDQVLETVEGLVRRALVDQLDLGDLERLAALVEQRSDLDQSEIEAVVGGVVAEVESERGKLARIHDQVTVSAISGLVVQGILAGLSAGF